MPEPTSDRRFSSDRDHWQRMREQDLEKADRIRGRHGLGRLASRYSEPNCNELTKIQPTSAPSQSVLPLKTGPRSRVKNGPSGIGQPGALVCGHGMQLHPAVSAIFGATNARRLGSLQDSVGPMSYGVSQRFDFPPLVNRCSIGQLLVEVLGRVRSGNPTLFHGGGCHCLGHPATRFLPDSVARTHLVSARWD